MMLFCYNRFECTFFPIAIKKCHFNDIFSNKKPRKLILKNMFNIKQRNFNHLHKHAGGNHQIKCSAYER